MKTATTLLAAAAVICTPIGALGAGGSTTTGNELYKACENEAYSRTNDNYLARGICFGIVIGVAYYTPSCDPPGVTYGQTLKVVVQYMQQHPEILQKELAVIARDALLRAWPCKQ
jgi:Rap1a immunity proteins